MDRSPTRLVHRGYDLLKQGGLNELARGVRDYIKYRMKNTRWKLKVFVSPNESRRSINGISVRLFAENPTEQFKLDTWARERDVLEYFISEVREDDVVWDVGSHLGVYTVFAKSIGASVVSFDPDPYYANRTQDNVDLNNYNVDVRNIALGSENRQMRLETDYGHLKPDTKSDEGLSVDVRSASDLILSDVPIPSVVKIDVEGAEVDVLKGMENILQNGECRVLLIEVHHDLLESFNTDESELKSILRKHNYSVQNLMSRSDTNEHIVAKSTLETSLQ